MRKGNKQKRDDLPALQMQYVFIAEEGNEALQDMQNSVSSE
jgi:hypothetical protein